VDFAREDIAKNAPSATTAIAQRILFAEDSFITYPIPG
jgi:hypothetical protein